MDESSVHSGVIEDRLGLQFNVPIIECSAYTVVINEYNKSALKNGVIQADVVTSSFAISARPCV